MVLVSRADGHLIAWDFTDSSSRPSYELKATHARVTTIEFLASGSTNTRQQLLAVGDETGTLHVFEVPRALIRPVPREEAIMAAFFDREQQRAEYVKNIPEIEGFTSIGGGAHAHSSHGQAESKKAPHSAAVAKSVPNTAIPPSGAPSGEGTGAEEVDLVAKAARDALKKAEDDFLKAEAAFIAELGLQMEDIPALMRPAYAASGVPKAEEKK